MADEYLTVAEVARRMRVSDKTVRRLVWSGDLPYIRLGTNKRCRIRIRETAVDRYMTSREQPAMNAPRRKKPAAA